MSICDFLQLTDSFFPCGNLKALAWSFTVAHTLCCVVPFGGKIHRSEYAFSFFFQEDTVSTQKGQGTHGKIHECAASSAS